MHKDHTMKTRKKDPKKAIEAALPKLNAQTIGRLRDELQAAHQRNDALTQSLDRLKSDVAAVTTLQAYNRELEAKINETARQAADHMRQAALHQSLNNELEIELADLKKKTKKDAATWHDLQAARQEVKALETHNAALAKVNQELQTANADLKKLSSDLTTQAENQRDAIEELEAKLTDATTNPVKPWDLQTAIAHAKAMEGEVARLNGIIDALKEDVAQAKADRDKPRDSKSPGPQVARLGDTYEDEERAHERMAREQDMQGVRLMHPNEAPAYTGKPGFGMIVPTDDIYERDACVVGTINGTPVKVRAVTKEKTYPKRARTMEITICQIERPI